MTADTAPILVADDQMPLRIAFSRALQRNGFETLEATTGPEVLEILDEVTCSALVLDNHMPGATGIELIEAVRARPTTRDLPIVLATGSSSAEEVELALRLGADEYLLKPVDLSDLVAAVERLVGCAAGLR
jgi:CheY-like chemotaxis protein